MRIRRHCVLRQWLILPQARLDLHTIQMFAEDEESRFHTSSVLPWWWAPSSPSFYSLGKFLSYRFSLRNCPAGFSLQWTASIWGMQATPCILSNGDLENPLRILNPLRSIAQMWSIIASLRWYTPRPQEFAPLSSRAFYTSEFSQHLERRQILAQISKTGIEPNL